MFVLIHTVSGFSIVNEAEVDVFLEFLCFFYYQMDLGHLISGSSASLKPSLFQEVLGSHTAEALLEGF